MSTLKTDDFQNLNIVKNPLTHSLNHLFNRYGWRQVIRPSYLTGFGRQLM